MPSNPLSRPLIEIGRDLRERRASARELVEAPLPGMSASASACTLIRSGRPIRPAPSPKRPMPHSPPGCRPAHSRGCPSR